MLTWVDDTEIGVGAASVGGRASVCSHMLVTVHPVT